MTYATPPHCISFYSLLQFLSTPRQDCLLALFKVVGVAMVLLEAQNSLQQKYANLALYETRRVSEVDAFKISAVSHLVRSV